MNRMSGMTVGNLLVALLVVMLPVAVLVGARLHSAFDMAPHQTEGRAFYSAWYVVKVDGKRYDGFRADRALSGHD